MDTVTEPELYNLKADPGEFDNVAHQHPDIVRSLMRVADDARLDLGDINQIGRNARFFDEGSRRPETFFPDARLPGASTPDTTVP